MGPNQENASEGWFISFLASLFYFYSLWKCLQQASSRWFFISLKVNLGPEWELPLFSFDGLILRGILETQAGGGVECAQGGLLPPLSHNISRGK